MNSLRNCKLVNLFKTVRPLKEKRGFGGWSATKIRNKYWWNFLWENQAWHCQSYIEMYLGTVIRHLSTTTEMLLPSSENHIFSPGSVGISRLFWQCFGIPPSTFRRHRQSSWVQHFCSWIEQASSSRKQSGHATHKSHIRFLSQDTSLFRVCTASSKNVRTIIAALFVSPSDALSSGCVKMILMNVFLHKRINWWQGFFPMKNRAAPSKKSGFSW